MEPHVLLCVYLCSPSSRLQVLKGHDDHVITCLQFCGNRIVSGSDDNTLKVWSAVTGKVSLLFMFFSFFLFLFVFLSLCMKLSHSVMSHLAFVQ